LRRFQTSSTSKHHIPSNCPTTGLPARRFEPSFPSTVKMQTYNILGRKVGSHYVSRALPIARRTTWTGPSETEAIEHPVLTFLLQLAMLTLGTLFGTSYAMAGGSKKPQAGATPPLNASSPDEADFIKCASPEHNLPATHGTWVRRSLTLEQEVPGQCRRQEGGEQALDWGNGPMTMRCATGLGCPVYIYHGRILGIDTITPCLQRVSLMGPVYPTLGISASHPPVFNPFFRIVLIRGHGFYMG
jgi:hypothetical protein